MKIISCSNSVNFVKDLDNLTKFDLIENEVSKFEDGEMLVKIKDINSVRNRDVLVIQSISENVNDAIMELLFTLDIVYNAMPKSIYLLITYLGYSRQDKIASINESFSLKVILKMLSLKYISKIFIVDIHSPQTMGFFNVVSTNISMDDFIIDEINKRFDSKDIILVSPDIGNAKNIINISSKMNVEYTIGIKYRPKANESVLSSLNGHSIENKICIIYDDIIDTAGTLCNVAELLKQQKAKEIYAFITHGVLSKKSFDRINNSPIDKVFITNTIDFSKKLIYSSKIEMISITKWCINILKKYINL